MTSSEGHQAIDAFGVPNSACSQTKSLPLDLRPDTLLPEISDRDGVLRRKGEPYLILKLNAIVKMKMCIVDIFFPWTDTLLPEISDRDGELRRKGEPYLILKLNAIVKMKMCIVDIFFPWTSGLTPFSLRSVTRLGN